MVEEYPNLDWANNKKSQKLTFGFIFILNREPVSWYSKKISHNGIIINKSQIYGPNFSCKRDNMALFSSYQT